MNSKFILIALVIAGLSSCSSAYKIGQTPDDVYFSPAPPQIGYVQANNDEDRNVYDNSLPEDREIRRQVNDRIWRRHPVDYGYDYPYGYDYNYPYGYYPPVYLEGITPTSLPVYKGPRKSNFGAYNVPPMTIDAKTGKLTTITGSPSQVRTFSRPQVSNGTGVGNFIRKVLSNPNAASTSRSNDNTQTRTFEPTRNISSAGTPSTNSTQSSNSGGNAPVRTFNK